MTMDDWFDVIAASRELSAGALRELDDTGFVVIPGPVPPDKLASLAEAYDSAVASASPDDVAIGGSTTRVHDFVNRDPAFDRLYVHQPVLDACCHVINRPFKLSTMLARTLRPRSPAQALHVDFERDAEGWPMVGFILMVDEFRIDNGATRFLPGSHRWPTLPDDVASDCLADDHGQVVACGPAGSIIVYNGSVLHGHTADSSGEPRRSVQGAYIRRGAESPVNLPARMRPETLARIGPLAKYLLAI
jgi:hypothetical protein